MPDDHKSTVDESLSLPDDSSPLTAQDDAALQNKLISTVESESGDDTRLVTQDEKDRIPDAPLPAETDSQPSPSPNSTETSAVLLENKKRPSIITIIAVVVVLLIGGVVAVYFWYQHPTKVVLDGVINAVQSKTATVAATAEITTESAKATLKLDGKGGLETGSFGKATLGLELKDMPKIKLEGEGIYGANGDVYFYAKNLAKTYNGLADALINQAVANASKNGTIITDAQKTQVREIYNILFEPVVTKIDNKWIKISVDDMKEMDKESGREYECTQNVLKKVMTEKDFGNQLRNRYMKNEVFIITETPEKKGDSKGYKIDIDHEASKKFGEELKTIPLYKDLQACSKDNSDTNASESDAGSDTDTQIILWIDQWSHTITGFKMNAADSKNQKVKIEGTTEFNRPVTVTPPKDSKSFKEVDKDIKNVMPSLNPISAQNSASPSARL